MAKNTQLNSAQDQSDLTPRQGEVLNAALELLVLVGDKLTMNEVAKTASCSKETLYNWFGDREGLLVAIVQWQAAKVALPDVDLAKLDIDDFALRLEEFGANLLGVLTSSTSVALNRVAISRAGTEGSNLGKIVLKNGRFAMGELLKPLLEAGKKEQLLTFLSSEAAYRCFFGLLLQDIQIRMLLGDDLSLSKGQVKKQAAEATRQFMRLHSI